TPARARRDRLRSGSGRTAPRDRLRASHPLFRDPGATLHESGESGSLVDRSAAYLSPTASISPFSTGFSRIRFPSGSRWHGSTYPLASTALNTSDASTNFSPAVASFFPASRSFGYPSSGPVIHHFDGGTIAFSFSLS